MASVKSFEPGPNSGKGFYWDEAILYAPQEKWSSASAPVFWRGPVFQIIPALQAALESELQSRAPQPK